MPEPETKWIVKYETGDKNSFKFWENKYPREFASCFDNLNRVVTELNSGKKLNGFRFNFFRFEKKDVWRIGQTGVLSAKETGLYVFVDQVNKLIHVLKIGGKDSQKKDIHWCIDCIKNFGR